MENTQAAPNGSNSPPESGPDRPPAPPPSGDGAPPTPTSATRTEDELEALYDDLFGTAILEAPPSPLEAFCMVYTLVRKHPEYAGTARAAVQAAENAVMAQTDVAARGGEGR